MLESELKRLNDNLERICSILEQQPSVIMKAPEEDHTARVVALSEQVSQAGLDALDKVTATPEVSLDDVKDLCLDIIRKDNSNKVIIKDLTQKIGGAKVLIKVKQEKLPELHKAIKEAFKDD